jgi:tetratricopeptide (TPR) repeat protein
MTFIACPLTRTRLVTPLDAPPSARPYSQEVSMPRPEPAATGQRWELPLLFVTALAFLLASFPARNADLWTHLVGGREAADLRSLTATFQDPLHPQARPGWLYDLFCYALFSTLGGAALVFVKALLVVGLALILLRLSRGPAGRELPPGSTGRALVAAGAVVVLLSALVLYPGALLGPAAFLVLGLIAWFALRKPGEADAGDSGPGWGLAAGCTALALVAMGVRLPLQPATVSCFLLGVTLWLLYRGPEALPALSSQRPWLPPWPLLVLFVLWANLDAWFVVGLVTVALVWLGQALDRVTTDDPERRMPWASLWPGLLGSLAVLAGVCLLNPAHVLAFRLPPELGWFGRGAASRQPVFAFEKAYWMTLQRGVAALAYFPLLVLGLLSFALAPRGRWQRFLPWVGLALLSAFAVNAIPFFAVVAGPVLAWNLGDRLARRQAAAVEGKPRRRTWRALAGVAAVLVLVCAWPGWLQAPPFEPRRWAVELPPSLEGGAQALAQWYRDGSAAPGRGLELSPATVGALAWYCPEGRTVVDPDLAAAFLGGREGPEDWRQRMRDAEIDHVIVYGSDPRVHLALGSLLNERREWALLYVKGGLAVIGWRDPERNGKRDPFAGRELSLERLAFQPAEDEKAPDRPPRDPRPRNWLDGFWRPVAPRTLDSDEATFYLVAAEALRQTAAVRYQVAWEPSQAAALIASVPGWRGMGALVEAHERLVLFRPQLAERGRSVPPLDRVVPQLVQAGSVRQPDDTPPAVLYLAIRAARRAAAANPDDAQAQLVLGDSYLSLLHLTRERRWRSLWPMLDRLRMAQASEALNRAVALKPDLVQAHLDLSTLYREADYLDLALEHLRAYARLVHEAGPPAGVSARQFRQEEEKIEDAVKLLTRTVEERQKKYESEATGARPFDRALLASRHGLKGKARDLLLEGTATSHGNEGVKLLLELLLTTGGASAVRDVSGGAVEDRDEKRRKDADELESALGKGDYYWLRSQAWAALGDYGHAAGELRQLAASEFGPTDDPRLTMASQVRNAILAWQGVGGPVASALQAAFVVHVAQMGPMNAVRSIAAGLRREAEATVLRGMLEMEQGEMDRAKDDFHEALSLWKDAETAATGASLDFPGRVVAQVFLGWIE